MSGTARQSDRATRAAEVRRRRPRTGPLTTSRVNDDAWCTALLIAGGDVRRLVVQPNGDVVVRNRPRGDVRVRRRPGSADR